MKRKFRLSQVKETILVSVVLEESRGKQINLRMPKDKMHCLVRM